MKGNVAFILEAKINDRTAMDLVMAALVAHSENEEGTLVYEWNASADGSTLVTYERFKDSAAALAHVRGFGAYAEAFMKAVSVKGLKVLGAPNDALRAAIDDFGPEYLLPIAGF